MSKAADAVFIMECKQQISMKKMLWLKGQGEILQPDSKLRADVFLLPDLLVSEFRLICEKNTHTCSLYISQATARESPSLSLFLSPSIHIHSRVKQEPETLKSPLQPFQERWSLSLSASLTGNCFDFRSFSHINLFFSMIRQSILGLFHLKLLHSSYC